MEIKEFLEIIGNREFYTGIPDSQLSGLCGYLMDIYGESENHVIGINEGNCVAMAAGYHLSTGKVPIVYLQNSGIGNIINPFTSLMHPDVYGIPCIFIIGWRGEPGIPDEPQHKFQGRKTVEILKDLDMDPLILTKDMSIETFKIEYEKRKHTLNKGGSLAIVVSKNALEYEPYYKQRNSNIISRESAIEVLLDHLGKDMIVSTTGKTSRELFEVREKRGEDHSTDLLTVGSMGHSSSIALMVARMNPAKRICCLDGDGALLMHMGSMALIGASSVPNLVHVVFNNSSHESVGAYPTICNKISLVQMAEGCGYRTSMKITEYGDLEKQMALLDELEGPVFIEIATSIGSRPDLGRPTISTGLMKEEFMKRLQGE